MTKCALECPATGFPKLSYLPGNTYLYNYSGKTQVQLKGVEDGITETDWSCRVELTWFTPCDMAIFMKNPVIDGVPDAARFLERNPLLVAVIDGRVQHVCSHPDDETWSINIKKGVASAFQNSLPSFSAISGMIITETDVVGKCPTRYEVESEGEKVTVKKKKNHRLCKERYPTPAKTQVPWLRGPLPLAVSESTCIQEIRNGLYFTITCEDMNVVRPSYGSYKHVEAKQESVFRYLSGTSEQFATDFTVPLDNMVRKSLLYDHESLKKDPSLVAQLDHIMSQICKKTKDAVERDVATLVTKAVHLLRRVPEEAVEQTLNKIRREHFCQGNRKLESIYLDIVAFVYDSGGVRVIVNELLNGQITGFRAVLYAAALYLQPRPCIHAIEALMPLFESSQSSNYITLAAASMVNNYCRHNSNCHDEEPVRSLAEALSNKLHYQCAPSSADEIREEALTTLKALGNMGVMAPNVVKSILKCLKTENISTRIRVAVVQAFRQANCNQPVTKQLMSIAVDPTETTEVRIASYIVAISCALDEDIKNIITKISKEKNTQVRAFILSHLHNIQQSNSPEKEKLRYYLSNIAIPRNFKTDIRKYSRNIDLSYFSQSLGIGAGLESNIIYAPGSFIPRSIDFNLSAALEGFSMNIGEVGVRFEGLEPVIEEVFGPDGYLHKASSVNFFEYLISIFKNNEGVNMMSLDRSTGKKISTEFSAISNFLNKIYDGAKMKVPRADIFARILGQDIYFVSLTSNLKDVIKQYVVNVLPSYLEEFIKQMMNLETESARTAQVSLDYIFPTIQGTPVKMKLKGIGVFGMTIVSKLNLSDLLNFKISNNTMKIIPSLSLQAKAFVGFDCFLGKLGLEMNSTGSSSTGVLLKIRDKNSREQELHLELPEKMELINIKSEVYLIKSIEGTPDTKVTPSSLRDIRVTHQSCVTSLEPMLGLEFCYELQVPDIFRSNVLPLGAPSIAKVYIQKAEASIKGYLINTVTQTMRGSKMLTAKIETIGSRTSRMVDVTLSCTKQEQTYLVSTTLESSSVSSGLWTTITNNEDQTDIEAFAKYRSRETEMTKGVKVHYKTVSSLAKEEYELKMHIGRNRDFYPASQILEGKFIKKFREPENSYDILLRTKNDFRNYFDFNFEVGINVLHTSSYVLLPTKIKKFEFHTGVGGWQVTSYMRHTRDSFLMAEYSSAFKLVRRHGDLISVEATHSIRSTDDPISTTLIARIGSDGYKASSDLLYGEYKMGLTMQAVRIHDNNKILHLDVFFSLMEEYKAKLELDIPEYIRAIKFESKIEVLGPYRYLFAAAFKHGTSVIMQVEGPLLVLITQAVVHLQAHIMVDALPSGLVRISTIIISARNKQQFSFELKNHRESLFDIDFNLGLESPQKTSIESKLYITEIIQHKLEIVIKNNIAYYNMNTVLLTNTSWARRVKSFVDVDMEHQRVTGELYWDSDRNSSKKVSCDATLVTSSSIPTQASVHGSVTYMGLTYSYKTEVNAASHCPLLCGMNIEVTTPTQAMFMVSASNEVHRQASDTRMNTLVHYKSLENKHYHLTSILDLKELDNQHSFQFESEIHFMSPEDENTTLKAEVETLITSQEQAAFLKLSLRTSVVEPSLVIDFEARNKVDSSSGRCMVGGSPPLTLFSWDMLLHQEGGIRSLNCGIDMTVVKDEVNLLFQLINSQRSPYINKFTRNGTYLLSYQEATPGSHSLLLQFPSRTMQAEAEYSSSEFTLRLYPKKHESESKYELTAIKNHFINDTQYNFTYEGRLNHPSFSKNMIFNIQHSGEHNVLRGKVELDVFPDPENMFIATLESFRPSPDSMKVVVHLTSALLKESPMVTIMAAYASHTVCFDVKFQKTPSSPELFQVLAKYDKIPTGDATLAFRVVSEEVAVVDIAGVATPDDPECDGFIVKAVTHNFPLGSYDIHAKLCRPFFIELISSKRGGEIYLLKVGNQNWKTWEASLSVLATEESDETRIMIGRFLLASPMMITADIGLNPNYGQVKLAVFEELDNVLNWCTLWVKKLYHDVVADLHDGSTSPRHRLLVLVQETKKELVLIYRDLVSDDLAPGTDLVGALLGGAWTQAVWQAYLLVFMEVAQLQHYCEAVLSKLIDDIYSECYHAIQLTTQVLVKAARCVESGEVPEAVHHLVEHMQETSLFRMLKTEVETLVERYPEEYDAIQQGVDKVKHTLQHDLDEIRVKFISTVTVSKYLTWINKYLDLEGGITDLRNEIIRIFIKNLLIKVNIHDGHLQANIPLPYPTFSISQAAEALSSNPLKSLDKIVSWPFYAFPVNINNCIWAYYTLLPRHKTDLLPPYNRTAMVVSDTEILTFDGALLRAPRSPCQVVLAVYANNKLTMAHPQPAAPAHITFSTGSTTVSIKPDFSVNINGQEMSRQRTTAGEVTVHKTSREVNIILPFMTVRVFRQERVVSVDVSGWIFSHIAGLLGTYDGEIGNDWFTPSGTNASSLQELVSSWQEDKQCRTPTISPFNYKSITVRKVVKCQALLGVRSRCSFVVHPESFVKMCHAARQPCDVAQAYHIICSNKGVNRLFSYIC
ncbi:vitellogenin-like isoform X2 [Cherax quadricarinatus]|nr:vitellogenin-like isoform X2 [Cherax quadricarinatus]